MKEEIDLVMDKIFEVLNQHSIKGIFLINDDDGKMGGMQLTKLVDCEDGKFLAMKFSGSERTLCPCCQEKEEAGKEGSNGSH